MEYPDYLYHHGILGMKWGVRRYQNEDGSWTDEGLARRKDVASKARDYQKKLRKIDTTLRKETQYLGQTYQTIEQLNTRIKNDGSERDEKLKSKRDALQKNADIVQRDYAKAKQEFGKTFCDMKADQDLVWKNTKTNFNEDYLGSVRKLLKAESGTPVVMAVYWGGDYINASSGNRITVRDRQSVSENTADRYSRRQSLQSYRPQIVRRYYY